MGFLRQFLSVQDSTPETPARTRGRPSNALAQLFQALEERTHPGVLDLGPVWNSSVRVLTEAGAKVYAEDLLAAFAAASAAARSAEGEDAAEVRFLDRSLRYPEESLDAILAWDVFEYLPEELLASASARLHVVLKPGGLLLTVFRSSPGSVAVNHYRLCTRQSFELVPAALLLRPQRVFQNRAILNLFSAFSASRSFVGRDNLREVLFVK